jgi:hypothetical protein
MRPPKLFFTEFKRPRFISVITAVAGAWLFALCLKLMWLHSATSGRVILESYNYFIDYIPGVVIGGMVLAYSIYRLRGWCLPREK